MPRNPWPPTHGNQVSARLVASETCPADELAPASPVNTDRSDRRRNGTFAPGNSVAKAKKVRSGPRGALAALETKGDPAAKAAVKWGKALRRTPAQGACPGARWRAVGRRRYHRGVCRGPDGG